MPLAHDGPVLAYVGLRWLSLACGGLHWPSLAVVGLQWLVLAVVGRRWPAMAFVGPVLACIVHHWWRVGVVAGNKKKPTNESS